MALLEILLSTFIRVYILEITAVLNYFTVTLCTFREFPLSFDFLKTFLVWVHGKSGRHFIGAREGAVLYVLQCRVSTERNFVFSGFSFICITSVKWKGFKKGRNVRVAFNSCARVTLQDLVNRLNILWLIQAFRVEGLEWLMSASIEGSFTSFFSMRLCIHKME